MDKYAGLILLLFLGACANGPQQTPAPMQGVMKDYLSQIKKFDGINEREAVLLAKGQLLFQGLDDQFYHERPVVEESATFFHIVFQPINHTLAEGQTNKPIQVIVTKEDGVVKLLNN